MYSHLSHTHTPSLSLSLSLSLKKTQSFSFCDVIYIFPTNIPVDSIVLEQEAKVGPCYKRLDPSVGAVVAGLRRHNASSQGYEGTARGCSGQVDICVLKLFEMGN